LQPSEEARRSIIQGVLSWSDGGLKELDKHLISGQKTRSGSEEVISETGRS